MIASTLSQADASSQLDGFMLRAFAEACAAQLILAWFVRKPWRRRLTTEKLRELEPEQIALISGGMAASVDAAVVRLVAAGQISVDGSLLQLAPRPQDTQGPVIENTQLEEHILRCLTDGPMGLKELRRRAVLIVPAVQVPLVQSGCILDRGRTTWARAIVAAPPLVLIVRVVALMIQWGGANGLPAMLVVGLSLLVIALRISPVTPAGERALARLRQAHATLQHNGTVTRSADELKLGFALFGTGVLRSHIDALADCISRAGSRIKPPLRPEETHYAPAPGPW